MSLLTKVLPIPAVLLLLIVCAVKCVDHHQKPLESAGSSASSSSSNDPKPGGHLIHDHHRQLRIAQIASLYQPVPALKYGAIERIIFHLTEELVRKGHAVTLFASSDSKTSAKLVSKWPSIFSMPNGRDKPSREEAHSWLMDEVRRRAHQFDILHFHTDFHFHQVHQIMRENSAKVLVTVHNLFSSNQFMPLCADYKDIPIVTLSKDQQTHLAKMEGPGQKCEPNFIGHVYYGLPRSLYRPKLMHQRPPYLAFLGRIHPSKMPDWAIKIALKAGIPLKIAAKKEKFHDNNDDYWRNVIEPLIREHSEMVEFIGEIDDVQKNEFLGNALALLFPIDWHEPFGLVMVEAMACGTPVVTRRGFGSVAEVITEGVTGQLFDTIDQGVAAVHRAATMDRAAVRREFVHRFWVGRMGADYEQIYNGLLLTNEGGGGRHNY